MISLSEFQDVCQELLSPCKNPYILNGQIYQIFRRYDRDSDGYLSYNEFSDLLLPFGDQRAANEIAKRRDVRIGAEAVELVKSLIKTQIKTNGSHEYLRARLRKALERQYLTLNDAFKSLDVHEKGLLNAYDL
jgi:Ca2+-binding EF-hand superfamily protein